MRWYDSSLYSCLMGNGYGRTRSVGMQWQKYLLLLSTVTLLVFSYHMHRDRWRLHEYYAQNSEKMKQALDSVSAQLQAVYQQKLRLQKSLKQKLDNEEQMKKELQEQLVHRNEEYESERNALQKELDRIKVELKLLRQSGEKLVQRNEYLNAKLNYEKVRCTAEIEHLKKPSNGSYSTSRPMEHTGVISVASEPVSAPLGFQNFAVPLSHAYDGNVEDPFPALGLQNSSSGAGNFLRANGSKAMKDLKATTSLDNRYTSSSNPSWTR